MIGDCPGVVFQCLRKRVMSKLQALVCCLGYVDHLHLRFVRDNYIQLLCSTYAEAGAPPVPAQVMPSQTGLKPYFHLFPKLPPEIRLQIWRDTLPDKLPPALHLYKRGCWGPRHLTSSDAGHESDIAGDNLVLELATEKLGLACFDIFLTAVSCEARQVAITWAAKQGVEIQVCRQRGSPAINFKCPFQEERDVLYVPKDLYFHFRFEPMELPFLLEAFRHRNYSIRNNIRQVAVPGTVLYEDRFSGFLHWLPYLEILYIIMGPQPDFGCLLPGSDVPWRRELAEDLRGAKRLTWNSIARGWHLRNGDEAQAKGDGELNRRLLKAAEDLREELLGPHMRDFQICVVRYE